MTYERLVDKAEAMVSIIHRKYISAQFHIELEQGEIVYG